MIYGIDVLKRGLIFGEGFEIMFVYYFCFRLDFGYFGFYIKLVNVFEIFFVLFSLILLRFLNILVDSFIFKR